MEPLSTDLWCLMLLALWSLVLNHVAAMGRIPYAGVKWASGNRETPVKGPPWIGRADRAKNNHHDNLAMIAVVILLAHVTGRADGVTANASVVLLISRVAHAAAYILGFSTARTAAYLTSVVALLTIAGRLAR